MDGISNIYVDFAGVLVSGSATRKKRDSLALSKDFRDETMRRKLFAFLSLRLFINRRHDSCFCCRAEIIAMEHAFSTYRGGSPDEP